MKEKHTAIVLAAGSGKRMHSQVQKQYMDLFGKPVLYYALRQFEECEFIDEVILVTKKDEIAYCREKIVEVYHLQKVKDIIEGGEERYLSVYNALKAAGAKVKEIRFPCICFCIKLVCVMTVNRSYINRCCSYRMSLFIILRYCF